MPSVSITATEAPVANDWDCIVFAATVHACLLAVVKLLLLIYPPIRIGAMPCPLVFPELWYVNTEEKLFVLFLLGWMPFQRLIATHLGYH